MAISALFIGCDLDVSYSGASKASDGTYLNSGTCTWTLTDSADEEVGSGVLAYQDASDGDYLGVIESSVTGTLTLDDPYTLTVLFTQGGYNDERVVPMRAAYRTAA